MIRVLNFNAFFARFFFLSPSPYNHIYIFLLRKFLLISPQFAVRRSSHSSNRWIEWLFALFLVFCIWKKKKKEATKNTINPLNKWYTIVVPCRYISNGVRIQAHMIRTIWLFNIGWAFHSQTHKHTIRDDTDDGDEHPKAQQNKLLESLTSVCTAFGIQIWSESGRHPFHFEFLFFNIQFAIWLFCKSTNGSTESPCKPTNTKWK